MYHAMEVISNAYKIMNQKIGRKEETGNFRE
jgi:hypothetical protein